MQEYVPYKCREMWKQQLFTEAIRTLLNVIKTLVFVAVELELVADMMFTIHL